ncbi:MAG: GNAT family N-acetyltransferase [Clostridia bacterium]|nr:GNAT family N-acetyltransferase [Clostridia bacterium]
MSIIIRPYENKDFDDVRLICVATASFRTRSEARRMFLLKLYCDYYLECEPENCYVAVDTDDEGNEKVVGYTLCAIDCESYAKRFFEKYLPKIKEYSKFNAYFARTEVLLYGKFASFFPAHMHIDILPAYQRQGIGTRLVDNIKEHLKSRGIKGVMLVAGKKNVGAKSFYLKNGFSFLESVGGNSIFGFDF